MLITSKARAWLHGALIAFVVGTAISIIAQQPVVFSSPQHVIVDTAPTTAVTGTFWQATQPVSGTFFQATQPISAVSLPLPTGAATETTLGTRFADATFTGRMPAGASPADTESNTITTLSRMGSFNFLFNGTSWDRQRGDTTNGAFVQVKTSALPTGAATETTLGGVLTTSDFDSKAGSLTETAPATDTASSGLNGRLQRIAQRLSSMIALLPTALGAGGGLKVDGSGTALPVSGTVTTTPPANASTNVAQVGGTAVVADPCLANARSFVSINQTTTTQILGLAGSSKKYYICSINLLTATAQNVAVIDSTTAGNACATSPSGSDGFGGSTAATGWNFAANGGIAYGAGSNAIGASHNANAALCIAQSSSGQVSGGISYVAQ